MKRNIDINQKQIIPDFEMKTGSRITGGGGGLDNENNRISAQSRLLNPTFRSSQLETSAKTCMRVDVIRLRIQEAYEETIH
jgi:hypothetical protein